MTFETGERGYIFSEDAELHMQMVTNATGCLAALVEGEQPTAEQWGGMLRLIASQNAAIQSSGHFVQNDETGEGGQEA